jgi:hypothetical protein
VGIDGPPEDLTVARGQASQPVAADRGTRVGDERCQHRELGGCEVDLHPLEEHLAGIEVDATPGPRDGLVLPLGRDAQVGPNAREQLFEPERLGHEVRGAQLEAREPVGQAGAGRQHDDRRRGPRAELLEHREPVTLRERQVEQEEVERGHLEGVEGLRPGRRELGHEAGALEALNQTGRDGRVVFHHQNPVRRHRAHAP